NHLGLTSNPLSDARKNELPVPSGTAMRQAVVSASIGQTAREQAAAPAEPTVDDDGVPDPELSEQDLFDLIAYTMLLAAPQAEPLAGASARGAELFTSVGCEGCHVQSLVGPRGRIPLYSDLLLHDMGPDLADGIEMKLATGSEFRTQPLWGVAATGPYLHDGRADTLHEAIVAHGGEALASADAYLALSAEQQDDVREFLLSLGGRDQMSDGLIPPDEAPPMAGQWGGPEPAVSEVQFEAGRRVFDRDVYASEGLGPLFNGDSCRACHFEPAVGGAGPNGVNVIRHGYVDGAGVFSAVPEGTVAHRLALDSQVRPPISANINLFELRQTPALFGLGQLDLVPESEILAREDPTDANEDGIRGVAHRLPDGRLGRFGWRADVPSLSEFARDALGAEMGVTVPDQPGLTYGAGTDDDGAADPEFSMAELDALVFYLSSLGAPPPSSTDAPAEARGANVFVAAGCDGCHRPSLPDGQGGSVDAYTDLLLHDVQASDHLGVPSFAATGRQYRTAPLWGVRATAPYWHDGHAETLEAAIAAHEGEAEVSRTRYEALDGAERADLLAFLRSL
ncbi:MAG: di-heme oxidoredictase family protein, partial [Myxococcota bacterium]